ncbi:cyclase [Tenacibaculum skagerrakense]|uniref:imidazole glycerol-phosphate synthase n=1 Tax=Tenacibaculum skagerrakense TaxID=186571 RepID=A0A4R2NMQ9_9FLAO|nr:imidazole glycerol phosphate synthase cyclase subunit [Tenacibaculum skagerrakense]TCP22917.1 cyclase [Tenacibaculum skagerrakense]
MKTIRIIPRLDIKGPNLVKGIHLEGLRVLGKPSDFAKFYYENGADELLFMDVVASLYDRNSLHDIISQTAENIFIPITVGGGLRTLDDIKQVLRAGADKVSLNTAAIKNPKVIEQAALRFGSSTIVVAIEAIKQEGGKYFCFTDNGREYTGVEVVDWAKKVQDLGAGEIIITSVDREGTGRGFDEELINEIASNVSVPLIVHGGAGKKEHFKEVIENCNIDAVSTAGVLHYDFIKNNRGDMSGASEGNFDFLLSGRSVKNLKTTTIKELKAYLSEGNINVR